METPQPRGSDTGTEADGYQVSLQFFEGPLDLLLHLIRKHEVDIYDIPIATITHEYLGYLELMKRLNLEVAGSFLEMAATLTYIKSRTLLPEPPAEEGEEGIDPRAELVEQLVEYQTCKDAADHLRQRAEEQARLHFRGISGAKAADRRTVLRELTLVDLLDAFQVIVKELAGKGVHEVAMEPLTVKDQIGVILERLEQQELILFADLFQGGRSISELVVTFLALLELIRLQAVTFRQEAPFAPIWILRREPSEVGPIDLVHDPLLPHPDGEA
ncbi:MAG: segregation/condensation protein A [Nitrospirota bacterium]|jgi:segregation and condensation protein A